MRESPLELTNARDTQVDVPLPMHIGIHETPTAGPGDCHIKGGYIEGTTTFTVKLACVSFYKNLAKGLPPGAGVFVVVDAVTGAPLGVFQENRWGGMWYPEVVCVREGGLHSVQQRSAGVQRLAQSD